jgi:AAA ATPase domain
VLRPDTFVSAVIPPALDAGWLRSPSSQRLSRGRIVRAGSAPAAGVAGLGRGGQSCGASPGVLFVGRGVGRYGRVVMSATGVLVGRDAELAALERALRAVDGGGSRAVGVVGEPGIGKSSLLAAVRARADDLRVVVARGGELEREFAFGIARQLLEPVLAAADDAGREALLARAAALAEPVLLASDDDGGAEPAFSALHGLYWLAVNLAERGPLLAVVDDLQWADRAKRLRRDHLAFRQATCGAGDVRAADA